MNRLIDEMMNAPLGFGRIGKYANRNKINHDKLRNGEPLYNKIGRKAVRGQITKRI